MLFLFMRFQSSRYRQELYVLGSFPVAALPLTTSSASSDDSTSRLDVLMHSSHHISNENWSFCDLRQMLKKGGC